MKKLMLFGACLLLSACGTAPGLALPGAVVVTDTIRQLCPNQSDAYILTTLQNIAEARTLGLNRSSLMSAFINGCIDGCLDAGGTANQCAGCAACGAALYQQAWPL